MESLFVEIRTDTLPKSFSSTTHSLRQGYNLFGLSIWYIAIPFAIVAIVSTTIWFFGLGREVQIERAKEAFQLRKELLQDRFLKAASKTGLPRGLVWKSVVFCGDCQLAKAKSGVKLFALAPVTITFEPITDSDMADVEAAVLPRLACAVYYFRKGEWHTDGKAIFNMSPEVALMKFASEYESLARQ
jgi:hypothetical protein